MTDVYLILVSRSGVELLTLETPHTRRFLARRCQRSTGSLACYWTVLPTQEAHQIRLLSSAGNPRAAQRLLDETSLHAGLLSPIDEEWTHDAAIHEPVGHVPA